MWRYSSILLSSCLLGVGTLVAFAAGPVSSAEVMQRSRTFSPTEVSVTVGNPLLIHNEDQFVHHLFVESSEFDFDSGEQRVGQTVEIKFPQAGVYQVR